MKKYFKIFILSLAIVISAPSNIRAQNINLDIPIPGIAVPGLTKTEFKICQIRRLFCGKTAIALIAFSIFVIGIMLLLNKMQWITALVMITGIVIFYNAEELAAIFGIANYAVLIANPMCDCGCNVQNVFNPDVSVLCECFEAGVMGVNIEANFMEEMCGGG